MKLLPLLLLLLTGCQYVRYIGAVPIADFNKHIEEAESLAQNGLENQGDISALSIDLANENIMEAKSDGDDAKLERSIGTKIKAEMYTQRAKKLSETEFTRAKEGDFDWGGIFSMVLQGLGAAFPALGGVMYLMKGKMDRIKDKAVYYAGSEKKDEISHDRDLV